MTPPTSGDIMRHALGVQLRNKRWSKPYRNRFEASGANVAVWRDLVARGLAALVVEDWFRVTEAGREYALAGIEWKRHYGYGQAVNP